MQRRHVVAHQNESSGTISASTLLNSSSSAASTSRTSTPTSPPILSNNNGTLTSPLTSTAISKSASSFSSTSILTADKSNIDNRTTSFRPVPSTTPRFSDIRHPSSAVIPDPALTTAVAATTEPSTPSAPTSEQTSSFSLPSTSESASAPSKSFLQETQAVAGTFTAVGLISVGIIIAVIVFWRKKRSMAQRYLDDAESDTNFGADPQPASSPYGYTESAGHDSPSSAPSFTNLTGPPMVVYTSHETHYGSVARHEISLTPDVRYGHPPTNGPIPVEGKIYEYLSGDDAGSASPQSFSTPRAIASIYNSYKSPISSPVASAMAPDGNRRAAARGSYQPSIDSFFGAT